MARMNAPPEPTIESYAPPARRRGYVRAMHKIAAERRSGDPVRVYYGTSPYLPRRDNWAQRVGLLRELLPDGVELLHYTTVFDKDQPYAEQWHKLTETLDGLVVTGRRRKPNQFRVQELGPVARRELISMVSAGKPVLVFSMEYGLVPVVDCQPKRLGSEPELRLKLTIPDGWTSDSPTLAAALDALQPPRRPE